MLRRRRVNRLKKMGLMSTGIRRHIANKRNTRRLVHRRIKQIPMSLEGSSINSAKSKDTVAS